MAPGPFPHPPLRTRQPRRAPNRCPGTAPRLRAGTRRSRAVAGADVSSMRRCLPPAAGAGAPAQWGRARCGRRWRWLRRGAAQVAVAAAGGARVGRGGRGDAVGGWERARWARAQARIVGRGRREEEERRGGRAAAASPRRGVGRRLLPARPAAAPGQGKGRPSLPPRVLSSCGGARVRSGCWRLRAKTNKRKTNKKRFRGAEGIKADLQKQSGRGAVSGPAAFNRHGAAARGEK